jgi:hypothetical protein
MKIEDEIERMLLSLDSIANDDERRKFPVTFWLPAPYKEAYDLIQKRSKRKFSNLLIEVIKVTIDRANQKGGV